MACCMSTLLVKCYLDLRQQPGIPSIIRGIRYRATMRGTAGGDGYHKALDLGLHTLCSAF